MDNLIRAWRTLRSGQAGRDYLQYASLASSVNRSGYFGILVAAADVILEAECAGEDPLPLLLVASGAVQ